MNTARLLGKHRNLSCCRGFFFVLLPVVLVLSGCATYGPRHIPRDRFSYNEALAESTQHQMMLNLVRMRYIEEPVFLSVSSILTQYVYNINAGAGTEIDLNGGTDIATGEANLGYEERPTITYIPIEGREFSERMLTAIPSETIFAGALQGWSVDIFMRVGFNRIGAVENMGFEAIPTPGPINLPSQFKQEVKKLIQFQDVIQRLIFLADSEAFEVRLSEKNNVKPATLVFADPAPEGTQPLVEELKQILGLSTHLNNFKITDRVTEVNEDEITVQTRSLAAMMAFMAKVVQVPPEHLADGRVIDYQIPVSKKIFHSKCSPARAGRSMPLLLYAILITGFILKTTISTANDHWAF